jgi:type I restriction enzyme S subunit
MKTGDMLVVMTDLIQSAPILGGAIVVPEDDRFLHNQRLGLVEFLCDSPMDKGFLYYLLNSPDYRAQVRGSATGATVRHTAPKRICDCNVLVPDTEAEQRRVAQVLSAYDDLIATNQRRIALLEAAARRLYREWFVHLRFPGHESVPVKSGVPEGWEKTPISAQTSFLNRGMAPKYDENAKSRVINQKCIRDGRLSMQPARRQSKEVKPDRLLRVGDVLINSTGAGTLGRVAQVRTAIEDCTVDTHVTIARPATVESAVYFGQALLSLEPVFSEMGKGATNQLELSRADIGAVQIWLPPAEVQGAFHHLLSPLLEQAEQLLTANQQLARARDLLLPKLMSGQLDVSGIPLPDTDTDKPILCR